MPHGHAKKYTNDVVKNICTIFYLHGKKYFIKRVFYVHLFMLTLTCSQVKIITFTYMSKKIEPYCGVFTNVKCLDFLPTIHTIMLNLWQFFKKTSFTHLIVDFVTIIGITISNKN